MERQIMPEVRILPTVKDVADFIAQKISFLPGTVLSRGDHTFENRGAAPMLDSQLDEVDVRTEANRIINQYGKR